MNKFNQLLYNIRCQIAKSQILTFLHNPQVGYGYFDTIKNEVIDDNDKDNPLDDSEWDNYKLMNPQITKKIKLGTCWDCALVIGEIFKKYNIQYEQIFLYGGGDQYTTHMTTIFKQNNVWYLCDNGWGNHLFGSNNNEANLNNIDKNTLINQLKIEHQKDFNLSDKVYLIKNYPPIGSTPSEFINYCLTKNEELGISFIKLSKQFLEKNYNIIENQNTNEKLKLPKFNNYFKLLNTNEKSIFLGYVQDNQIKGLIIYQKLENGQIFISELFNFRNYGNFGAKLLKYVIENESYKIIYLTANWEKGNEKLNDYYNKKQFGLTQFIINNVHLFYLNKFLNEKQLKQFKNKMFRKYQNK